MTLRAALLAAGLAAAALSGCTARAAPIAAAPAIAAPPPARVTKPVVVAAVGDLMLGTSIKGVMRARGAEHPFRPYREVLTEAGVAFGNLETPISDRGSPTPGKSAASLRSGANYLFRVFPEAADGLAWAGFDIVSVSNNHTMDYGWPALQDTLEHCSRAGVLTVGGGRNLGEAGKPVVLESGGQKLAFFAISDIIPAFSAAGPKTPGLAPARGEWFEAYMPRAIQRARREADWVLVSVHWGKERYTGATPKQKRLGRRLVDWGADVVIGHHTHCEGPVERYRGGLIHYSLGNFISYVSSRAPVEIWEVTLPARRGGKLAQRRRWFSWDGTPISR